MMAEQNMQEFIEVLSSKAAVPGGGGACAYVAAAGMALGAMVANLTTGKKKYAQYQEEIEELLSKAEQLSKELMTYMDKDAESFEPLSKAYGLPKDTKEQQEYKEAVMEKALKEASLTPVALMEKILDALKILERLSVVGSRLAISDCRRWCTALQGCIKRRFFKCIYQYKADERYRNGRRIKYKN